MSTPIRQLRGTASELALYTGAQGVMTVNETANSIHVHDGLTPGGHDLRSDALTRTALAALVPRPGATRYLSEAGREGWFRWDSSNLSSWVTLDTQQGVYVPPASAPTGASGAWVRILAGQLNASWFGMVGNGVSGADVAYRKALAFWERTFTVNGFRSPYEFIVPGGIYNFAASVDATLIFSNAGQYFGMKYTAMPGTLFYGTAALNPLLKFGASAASSINGADLRMGTFTGNNLGGAGIWMLGIVDGFIHIDGASGFKDGSNNGTGILFDTGLSQPVYNSKIVIGNVNGNGVGVLAAGTNTPPHGFQGNQVFIGHLHNCATGIFLSNQSTANSFTVASSEANTRAVFEGSGYNEFHFSYCGGEEVYLNTPNDVKIAGRGFTVTNNGGAKGHVVRNDASVTPVKPTVPASTVPYRNNFLRPASVTIMGGNANVVIGDVVMGVSQGTFKVAFGQVIYLQYSVAPTWVWTFD